VTVIRVALGGSNAPFRAQGRAMSICQHAAEDLLRHLLWSTVDIP